MKKTIFIAGFLCAASITADTGEEKKRVQEIFNGVPRPELPAKAAEVVRNTPASERAQAAIITVEAILERHPAAGPMVVAAISKAAPETSPAAAAAAVKVVPKQAHHIELAAQAAAPAQAGQISLAVAEVTRPAPVAAGGITALHHRPDHSQGGGSQNGNGNENPGPGNGNGNANGGVGLGPGPDKPGAPVVFDRPINTILPNGKPRHFPPTPPRRPVTPPRPHQYNQPHAGN